MEIKKRVFYPLITFAAGLIILIAIDYSVRLLNGNTYTLGLPETLWFSLQILITVLSFSIYINSSKGHALTNKILIGSLMTVIGITLYVTLVYGYIFTTQIDGF